MINESAKTLPELITQLKDELQEFVATRVAMLRAEFGGKLQSFKLAAPSILIGLVLVATGWLVLTAFLVAALANAFDNPWRYPIALVIVGMVYSVVGAVVLTFGWQKIKAQGLTPERTIRVLKQDQVWLQTEVKTQL
jgi:hypothetical protein